MARTSLYPKNNFERLLWWFILAALSWALVGTALLSSSCTYLPGSGPSSDAVVSGADVATGLDREASRRVIEAAEGNVKTAIVMARRGVSKAEAEKLLAEHAGRLRPIVGDPPPVRAK